MTEDSTQRIRIGISSCLTGEKVRYNGEHKRDHYITEVLSRYFEFAPCCPEVAIGLGIPRPVIHLEGDPDRPRAVIQDGDRRDVTEALSAYGRGMGETLNDISGYIFKSRSPSCGLEGVRVYDHNNVPVHAAVGIYSRAFRERQPLLPVAEEEQLHDPDQRDNFIERVFVYSEWQNFITGDASVRDLIEFHTRYKFLIMSHDQDVMDSLDRLAADAADDPDSAMKEYFALLMRTLKKPVRRGGQADVFHRMAEFFRDDPEGNDRRQLREALEGYRAGGLPVIVPLTLIHRHLRGHY